MTTYKYTPGHRTRNMESLQRILTLIDVMAPLRNGQRASEIHNMLCERLGVKVNRILVYRDLETLESLGLATYEVVCNVNGHRNKAHVWKLDLKRTESLQLAALKV